MKRAWVVAALTFAVLLLVSAGVLVRWRAQTALSSANADALSERELRFTLRPLGSAIDSGFESVSAPSTFRSAAIYQDHLYLASSAGLFEYDERGNLLHDFRVGRELPPSPLTQLTQGVIAGSQSRELIIGTENEGVLLFDGHAFRQLRTESADARSVNALLPLRSGQLLIGTPKKGVLVFDGVKITPFHDTLKDVHVTSMSGDEGDIWVGTLADGAIHWHAGQAERFTEAEGLPDIAVHSMAAIGNRAYAGTSAGVAEFVDGKFKRVIAAGMFALSVYADSERLLIGTVDEGMAEVPIDAPRLRAPGRSPLNDLNEVRQILHSGAAVYAVAPTGVYQRTKDAFRWKRVLTPDASMLADRNVSAIAGDQAGKVWVGYFDHGLDVVDSAGTRARHIENDHVFCVNRIVIDPKRREVNVATANGLVLFDESGREQHVMGKSDGLMAEHVTDVVLRGNDKVFATPAGLTFIDAGGARSLYAFHGLVNNHVYALAASGRRVIAGTLGGISLMNDDQVVANVTTASSGLKHNWVTAIVQVDTDWFVGTYGAGVMRVTADGKVEPMEVATAPVEVNPNAMLTTKDHVFAGTLSNGLYVFDRKRQKWWTVNTGLPSMNVTALAEIGGYIYVGTENGLVRVPESRLQP
jgi:ligand-binding sensor domain-containing protein